MSDENSRWNLPEEPPGTAFPWRALAGALLALGALIFFFFWSRSADSNSAAQVAALEKSLDADQAAMEAHREKVVELTQELDGLKQSIQRRRVPNARDAVARYNALAVQQRAERDQVKTIVERYNQKVARLRDLEP